MAGNENSGGYRPTAPQNNPANINALGGNGQSGRNANYTGFAYGENKAVNEQRKGAKMAMAPEPTAAPAPDLSSIQGLLAGITPIDADPADPTLPVSTGVNVGRGAGEEAMPAPYRNDRRQVENIDLIKKYLPDLMNAAKANGAPDSYKQLVNYLKSQVI